MSRYDNILARLSSESRWTPENEKAVLEPYEYLLSTPGKEFRTQLIDAFNKWLAVPGDTLQIIAKIVNMLHSASLMVDDIEDDSQLRRGKPVTHKIYGVPQTINTGNYVYFLAYRELLLLREPAKGIDVEKLVTDELLSLHRGQGLELLWRDSLQCPTEDEYIDMVNNKTGGLLRIGIRLMMACSTQNRDMNYIPLVNLIGVFFQIRDDLMNLQSVEYSSNKGFAEDLTEGKFSFPVVHGIHADMSNRQILNVLQKRPATPTLKIHTISYLKDRTKSFEYTFDVLDSLERQMRQEIDRLGGNPSLMKIVDLLSVDRSKLVH
ncbi:terpenoid synthase [Schizophyllum commune H4-8]|uniref:(2E,6E)-farnesyl diphosphate synthase n=1 Tax=Schizophyllum commune (strain H4-8 / FGSC 9210) TaxID=578458 RepID=D8PXY0_SCHCM|nr:terpenoid synthase [Schizophyllum commune H4-8]KAI5897094.1 terpenoid synthase [Schizophyllum commune H4-8]